MEIYNAKRKTSEDNQDLGEKKIEEKFRQS